MTKTGGRVFGSGWAMGLLVAGSLALSGATAGAQAAKAPGEAAAKIGATRVAFVDIERISTEAKFVRDLLGDIEKAIESRRAAIEKKQQDYAKIREDLTRKREVLSEAEYEANLKESRRLRTELEEDDYQLNKILRENQKEKMAPALERILKAVQEVSKREGFDIVLRGEMVVHGDPSVDLSDRVVEYLNAGYSPGTKEDAGPKSAKDAKATKRAPTVSTE